MKRVLLLLPVLCLLSLSLMAQKGRMSFLVKDIYTGYRIPAFVELLSKVETRLMNADISGRLLVEESPGRYELTIKAPGYKPLSTYFFIEAGKNLPVTIYLDPVEIPAAIREMPAPSTAVIDGYLTDALTGKKLKDAIISFSGPESIVLTTNADGYFHYVTHKVSAHTSNGIIPVYTDIRIGKPGYATKLIKQVLLQSDRLTMKLELESGTGTTTETRSHKLLQPDTDKSASPAPAPEAVTANRSPDACTVPATIRVGTPCACANCSGVSVMSLESYVGTGVDDEWFSSWNAEALKAGCVAYRSYGSFFVVNFPNTINGIQAGFNYDIASTACNQAWESDVSTACQNAAAATASQVLVNSAGAIRRSEYASETNNFGCGNGFTGTGSAWPCIADNVCVNQTPNGHGRGLCQFGSQRWASTQAQTYTWILDHYYNVTGFNWTVCTATAAPCTPPAAPVAVYGSAACPGTAAAASTTLTWNSTAPGHFIYVSEYPYGTPCKVYETPSCVTGSSLTPPFSFQPGKLYRWNMQSNGGNCSNAACNSPISNTNYFYVPPAISPNTAQNICSNGSVQFSTPAISFACTGGSVSYAWFNGATQVGSGTSYTATTAGNYRVELTYTGSAACASVTIASAPVTVMVLPPVTPSLQINYTGCPGNTLVFGVQNVQNAGNSPVYNWFLNGVGVATGNTYTLSNAVNGQQVYCQLSSNAACASPAVVNSNTETVNCITTGVSDISGLESFSLSPNPSNGIFTISIKVQKRKKLQVNLLTIDGRLLKKYDAEYINGSYNKTITLKTVPPGTYLVETWFDGQRMLNKVVIQ
jgi:Stage II sporulation protein/Secretion system C-terminal sorting domain